jgi:hypothetical protein
VTRRLRTTLWLVVAASLAGACQQNTNPAPPAVLNRSGDVALVCYDIDAADDDALPLPLQCCAGALPLATDFPACPVRSSTPTLHGLITQTARGEVAAVDLDNNQVVDSDKLIPGYTFVDVGGLPQALVVPKAQLADDGAGPRWAYVAGGDLGVVQAVATCRFFRGERCGPELDLEADALAAATRVVLPGAPGDMVLSSDGSALWVAIPDQGLLARVALSDDPALPFVTVDGAPAEPSYFAIPSARAATPLEVAVEAVSYEAVCGLGYEASPKPAVLPLAPTVTLDPALTPRPSRLRLDAATGLLFVADAKNPVLRAFSPSETGLTLVGEWNTGRPLTDYALTDAVPASAPDMATLVSAGDVAGSMPEDSVRYLYAIDDEGLVQVFGLGGDASAPTLSAIAPPLSSLTYRDRLRVNGRAVALDVIDTRLREPYLCGADESDLAAEISDLDGRVDAQAAALKRAERAGDSALVAELQAELDRLELEQSIRAGAGPSSLRGVFVAVVSSVGVLDVLDVHDLDLSCRAALGCSLDEPYTDLRDTVASEGRAAGTGESLAVRRHAERISSAGDASVTVAGEVALDALTCPDGFVAGLTTSAGETRICLPADPWFAADQTWSLGYEGRIPTLTGTSGMLDFDADGQLWLSVPSGFDLCQRGIEVDDGVYITTNPSSAAPARCPRATTGTVARLRVVEAFADRLRVEPVEGEGGSAAPDADTLVECYPEFIGYEVHPLAQYLVLGADGAYLHRIIADGEGRCVPDEDKDPRLQSRLAPATEGSSTFVNPFVAFSVLASDTPANVAVTVRITGQSARVQRSVLDSNGRVDTLPARVRFFPEAEHLYVVDAASQGLRRFVLSPNLQQTTAFR